MCGMRHKWSTVVGRELWVTEEATNTPYEHDLRDEILRLAEENRALRHHLQGVRERLRIECAELGDNDWPDDLHLGDVIERHFADPAAARIAALEADLEQARRDLAYCSEIRVRAEKRCAELATLARLADAAVKQSRDENGQLRAEVERYVEESGRHAKAFRLQLDRAVAAEAERDRALAEVERLRCELRNASSTAPGLESTFEFFRE